MVYYLAIASFRVEIHRPSIQVRAVAAAVGVGAAQGANLLVLLRHGQISPVQLKKRATIVDVSRHNLAVSVANTDGGLARGSDDVLLQTARQISMSALGKK